MEEQGATDDAEPPQAQSEPQAAELAAQQAAELAAQRAMEEEKKRQAEQEAAAKGLHQPGTETSDGSSIGDKNDALQDQLDSNGPRAADVKKKLDETEAHAGGAGELPEFPWPPPQASASYVLPDRLLASYHTVGDVVGAIIGAMEQSGYVERSFFRTEAGGVALVTRLERINDDGTPSLAAERWPNSGDHYASRDSLFAFLQGLFYVDPGHYRVIVFVLQDLPFSQSSANVTADEARAWLVTGANVLPPRHRGASLRRRQWRPLHRAHL